MNEEEESQHMRSHFPQGKCGLKCLRKYGETAATPVTSRKGSVD